MKLRHFRSILEEAAAFSYEIKKTMEKERG